MHDVMARRWPWLDGTGVSPWLVAQPPVGARFLLEDYDGYPIDCPLCGQADGWRMLSAPGSTTPRAFACAHAAPDGHGGQVRLTASVSADQVGGYLDPMGLLMAAA